MIELVDPEEAASVVYSTFTFAQIVAAGTIDLSTVPGRQFGLLPGRFDICNNDFGTCSVRVGQLESGQDIVYDVAAVNPYLTRNAIARRLLATGTTNTPNAYVRVFYGLP
jgi:hypothetical protein